MQKHRVVGLLLAMCVVFVVLPSAAARSTAGTVALHLRRATFDPLQATPAIASAMPAAAGSTLRLVQLSAPPNPTTAAQLEAAGMHPLIYVPDNAFLVRMRSDRQPALAAVRWSGAFQLAYKLPAELDALLTASTTATETLRLLATPDADTNALAAAIQLAGGVVLQSASGLNGATFRVQLPVVALAALLQRDDVLWAERYYAPRTSNDKARDITGVTTARQQLTWLTGAGQIVAVTDTGLDEQNQLSADFAGRVVAAFNPSQMSSKCSTSDWSDRAGHGTHVSGTVLGNGANSPAFAGFAPEAGLVVESVSSGGSSLDCLTEDAIFLAKAYDAGARVQNASWGGPTGSASYGGYDSLAAQVDDFLWTHKDHLLVVAAGNQGEDSNANGVIDDDSINSPGTAKNVLTVGASENDRPPTSGICSQSSSGSPENFCWDAYVFPVGAPLATDFVSDNPNGIAGFSSRGPANDGRIKPEIVAPGTNIISTRSHNPNASYADVLDANYAYDSGTSMATPMVSGAAALVRQWLATARGLSTPSAALVKALLLNGATNISPGQYGTGSEREIPAAWPNNVEGWGRMSVDHAVQLADQQIWFTDTTTGLNTDESDSYPVNVATSQPLQVTLAWTDYPASPFASKTLVNDLDLEVQAPDGTIVQGNANIVASSNCAENGADRCNNVESVEIANPQIGIYTFRVRGHAVAHGPQPYALAARAPQLALSAPQDAPVLQAVTVSGPLLTLNWTPVSGATSYAPQVSADSSFVTVSEVAPVADTSARRLADIGSYAFRVRGCNSVGCGPYSNVVTATVTIAPWKEFFPVTLRE